MRCRCGYAFHEHVFDKPASYKSFATIDDADYRKFLRLEKKVMESKGADLKSRAVAKAAQFVGTIKMCPDCGRLVWNRPDGEGLEFFVREAETEE